MNNMMKSVGNLRTTIVGVLLAILTYWSQIGTKLPQNKGEWFAFLVATGMAALGVLAKDGATGSSPGDAGRASLSAIMLSLALTFGVLTPLTLNTGCSYMQKIIPGFPQTSEQSVQALKGSAAVANNAFAAAIRAGQIKADEAQVLKRTYFDPMDVAIRELETASDAGRLDDVPGLLDEAERALDLAESILRARDIQLE